MQAKPDIVPGWQELFSGETGFTAATPVRWRILRRHGEPLLILPQGGREAVAALALYPAQTAKARLAKTLLHRALQCRLPLPPEMATLAIDPLAPFAAFLARQAGTKAFPATAILAGNAHTPGRRFILLLFSESGEPRAIVKAGLGPEAATLIEREHLFLVSTGKSGPHIPSAGDSFHDGHVSAFAMEHIDGVPPSGEDEALVEKIVSSWVGAGTIALNETAPWRHLEAAYAGRTDYGRLVSRAIEALGKRSVKKVLWHGDLTPWNVRVDGRTGRCVVLDWERAEAAGVPAWDWFHYRLQTGILVQKLSPETLRDRLTALLESPRFGAYAERCGIRGVEKALVIAYLFYSLAVLKPSEGAETTLALSKLLADSWINA